MEKENSIKDFFDFVDCMYNNYKLPDIDINKIEWQAFFDVTYELYLANKKRCSYYDLLYMAGLSTFNCATETITLADFLASFDRIVTLGFKQKDIDNLKEEVMERSEFGKIIPFPQK